MESYEIKPDWRDEQGSWRLKTKGASFRTLGFSVAAHLVIVIVLIGWMLRRAPSRPVSETYLTAHLVGEIPGSDQAEGQASPAESSRPHADITHALATRKRLSARALLKTRAATVKRSAHKIERRRVINDAESHVNREISGRAASETISPEIKIARPAAGPAHSSVPAVALKTFKAGAGANPNNPGNRNGAGANRSGGGFGSGAGGHLSVAHAAYGEAPAPEYPEMARELAQQGVVTLRVLVGTDGSVKRANIAKSSGFDMLDSAALETVRDEWRFVPARRGNVAIASWVLVPIRFSLSGVE